MELQFDTPVSEDELQGQLHLAGRSAGALNLTETAAVQCCVRATEYGGVEGVKKLRPELERHPLPDCIEPEVLKE